MKTPKVLNSIYTYDSLHIVEIGLILDAIEVRKKKLREQKSREHNENSKSDRV